MTRIVDPEGREVDVLRRLVSFKGKDVLDVGCGEGRTSRFIAQTAASMVGIDPDEARIATARESMQAPGSCAIDYLAEDVVTRDWPAGSFDAVIFTRSL